jgi:C-terminal peptidase prc
MNVGCEMTNEKSIITHYTLHIFFLLPLLLFTACSDFLTPVKGTSDPTEYEYNYWLLQHTYLFEDELSNLPKDGDSVGALYAALSDKYTQYIEPSYSEDVEMSINTSIVPGDVGMTYLLSEKAKYPLFTYRVYPNGPAGKAGVPRYANIRSINGIELTGEDAYSNYRNILDTSATVELVMTHDSSEYTFTLTKETIYAPTVFVDTLYGTIFVSLTGFKLSTADQEGGSYGELRSYLDSTQGVKEPRVIDIRGNPGGHVEQCIAMADLFVKKGPLSTRSWRTFEPDGKPIRRSRTISASEGDAGEKGKFIILANDRSASCPEIFAAAVTENTDIPLAGTTTYGKGIGQTNWKTAAGGLAIITNLEFLTPKGNSYHHKGIVPDYECNDLTSTECAVDVIEKHFGKSTKKSLLKGNPLESGSTEFHQVGTAKERDFGGAMLHYTDL